MPVSAIYTHNLSDESLLVVIVICPFGGVNFTALLIRFQKICCSRAGSARICTLFVPRLRTASDVFDRFPADRFRERFAATYAHQRLQSSAALCRDRYASDPASRRSVALPIPRCDESSSAIRERPGGRPAHSPTREQKQARA